MKLIDGLLASPWNHGFLALMRRFGANPAIDPVGTAMRPHAEPFRVGQKPSLAVMSDEVLDYEAAYDQKTN
ncbi:type VI secretion system baseplate subunit TssG [Paraburkholderia sp.]|uniref:type VI secretion system baseplate subunit TssG n=1 Tax=Paraburkholderia sp. TaxID=1926495 RepID=UPI0038621363